MDKITTQIVIGLAFGDEGKGSMVDYLAHETPDPPIIVRFNGGSQAAHNVVTPNRVHHTFSQFGSGMFRPGATTHLSRFMLVNPLNMISEAEHLQEVGVPDVFGRTSIAASAPIITPYHQALNRLREMSRGDGRHGSCGQGIGELMADTLLYPEMILHAEDLASGTVMRRKLEFWRDYKRDQAKEFGPHPEAEIFNDDSLISELIKVYKWFAQRGLLVKDDWLDDKLGRQSIIFEGAQGVLLDETYGFNPYTTWSSTTPKNARTLLGGHEAEVVGVVRNYYTRHGAGPFPTEKNPNDIWEPHNTTGTYQGHFRTGIFDEALFNYALRVCNWYGGVDSIAVTHMSTNHKHFAKQFTMANYKLPFDLSTIENPTEMDQVAMLKAIESIKTPDDDYRGPRGSEITKSIYFQLGSWETIAGHLPSHTAMYLSTGPTRNDKTKELTGLLHQTVG